MNAQHRKLLENAIRGADPGVASLAAMRRARAIGAIVPTAGLAWGLTNHATPAMRRTIEAISPAALACYALDVLPTEASLEAGWKAWADVLNATVLCEGHAVVVHRRLDDSATPRPLYFTANVYTPLGAVYSATVSPYGYCCGLRSTRRGRSHMAPAASKAAEMAVSQLYPTLMHVYTGENGVADVCSEHRPTPAETESFGLEYRATYRAPFEPISCPYCCFTVVIPAAPPGRSTEWHAPAGRTATAGAFKTKAEAHRWAERLNGAPYSVQHSV